MTRAKSLRRKNNGTRNAVILIALFAAASASVAYLLWSLPAQSSAMVLAGQQAPSFRLTSAIDGRSFNLTAYAGESDVLLFFNEGLSCSPCLQQMVELDRDYPRFSDMGVMVASITTDPASSLGTWARSNGILNMMVLSDSSLKVDQTYGTMGAGTGSMHQGMAPGHTFILVDKDGTVVWRKDYGTYTMYVPVTELMSSVRSAMG